MPNGKKEYKCLIFDADHTLLDYEADEKAAFRALYEKLGMPPTDELVAVSRRASEGAWIDAGLYNVNDKRVQAEYHTLYHTHTEEIFRRIFAQFPCAHAQPKATGLQFLEELKIVGEPLGNALAVLHSLSRKTGGKYAVYIATNGLSRIQQKRLERFLPLVEKAFISEEMQTLKPLPTFFERILRETGFAANECLMIGDSLVSDISGANGVGIDTCWFNPTRRQNDGGVTPDYEIAAMDELLQIV